MKDETCRKEWKTCILLRKKLTLFSKCFSICISWLSCCFVGISFIALVIRRNAQKYNGWINRNQRREEKGKGKKFFRHLSKSRKHHVKDCQEHLFKLEQRIDVEPKQFKKGQRSINWMAYQFYFLSWLSAFWGVIHDQKVSQLHLNIFRRDQKICCDGQ